MDEIQGQRICELVAGIISVDHELHPSELKFMARVFSEFGLARDTGRDQVMSPTSTTGEAVKQFRELPGELQAQTLELLIQSAISDGKVVPSEHRYLLAVAQSMGVGEDELDERVTDALLEAEAAS